MLKKQRADYILARLNELYPETPVPLDHKDNFTLLVAVLLSAQCTDERVNQVTPSLFKLADNPYEMQHIPVDEIYKLIRPCGLAPQKSSAISKLSAILVEKFDGQVPNNFASLESLPGVGHKTAGVVTLGTHQRQKCCSDRTGFKGDFPQRTVEQTASANYLLWQRVLLCERL